MNLEDELTQYFLMETTEKITELSSHLLDLENNPSNEEVIKELFRIAHTLKGNSKTYYNEYYDENNADPLLNHVDKIAKLTHKLEDLITEIRDQKSSITAEKIDVFFQSENILETLVSYIENGNEDDYDISPMIQIIENLLNPNSSSSENNSFSSQAPLKVQPQSLSARGFQLIIDLDPEFPYGHLGIIYRKIIDDSQLEHIQFSPSEKEIINMTPFEKIFVYVESDLSNDEIVSKLKVQDVIEAIPLEVEEINEKKENNDDNFHGMSASTSIIRVPVARIDEVYRHVSSFVVAKNKLATITSTLSNILDDENDENYRMLKDISDEISSLANYLQDSVLKIRMTPLSQLFNHFRKDIRNTAKKYNKKVPNFKTSGGETEIDKSLFDELQDPLMHLTRNSIVHGIENEEERIAAGKNPVGTLSLVARKDQSEVEIVLSDDGRGIDVEKVVQKSIEKGFISPESAENLTDEEKINLIFFQGVSTAERVSDEAGRGVGMDAVRSSIEAMKGTVSISSELGKGTKTTIRFPITLASFTTLLTRIGNEVFAFPLPPIFELAYVSKDEIQSVANQEILIFRNLEIPLIRMRKYFNMPSDLDTERHYVVILTNGSTYVGAVVDEFMRKEEIVAKNINYLTDIKGVSGCHILGDGRLSLIIDINSLFSAFK